MSAKPVFISVVMIVRNEEACIEQCLGSVREADEICVLDTGSTDSTILFMEEWAKRSGATERLRIGRGSWHDDFAAARNEALMLAADRNGTREHWILSIDADEVLQPGGIAAIREACAAETERRTLLASMQGRGSLAFHFPVRIFRKGVRWTGRAHEVPEVNDARTCVLANGAVDAAGVPHRDALIVYGWSPAHHADPDRMLRILTAQEADERGTPEGVSARTLYYLAREHWYRKDSAGEEGKFHRRMATELFLQRVKAGGFLAETADAWLYLARLHWEAREGDRARECCANALVINADFREAHLLMAEMSWPHNAKRWRQFAGIAKNEQVLFVRA